MEAVILAGGFGTRLKKISKKLPKPMVDINGIPFLEHLLNYLNYKGFKRAILSVGYKFEVIKDYFGDKYKNIELIYSIEDDPLGTGGAIKKGLKLVQNDCFVFNGDTFFDVDFFSMKEFYKKNSANLVISLKNMQNFDRYGTVNLGTNQRIEGFSEKQKTSKGLINGGVYYLEKGLLDDMGEKFSFEKDFLERFYQTKYFYGVEQVGYFIDIGIPEDYYKACEFFSC